MSLELLEIPDDVLHWPGWLERQLVGLHLRDLVAQLKLISDNRPSPTIEEVCGEQLEQLLQNGLVALSVRQIGRSSGFNGMTLNYPHSAFVRLERTKARRETFA